MEFDSWAQRLVELVKIWLALFAKPMKSFTAMLGNPADPETVKAEFRIKSSMGLFGVSLTLYVVITGPLFLAAGLKFDDPALLLPIVAISVASYALLGVSLHFSLRAFRIPSIFSKTLAALALSSSLLIPLSALTAYANIIKLTRLTDFAKSHPSIHVFNALIPISKIMVNNSDRFLNDIAFPFIFFPALIWVGLLMHMLSSAYSAPARKIALALSLTMALVTIPLCLLVIINYMVYYSFAQLKG